MAASLLSQVDQAHDSKERGKCLREARATLELAERVANGDPDSDSREISDHLEQLKDRLDQLSATYRDSSAR